jgi:CheY-like chemotaxis protein
MPKILVVDDSPVTRDLAGKLLAEDPKNTVAFASDGREGLALMESDPPDLVLTDLIMPEINGLRLVAEVKERFRHVPVILMTSQGNEQIAVEALRRGAASYVPKQMLTEHLRETVDMVLALSHRTKCHQRLMECITTSEYQFRLRNDPELISPMVRFLQDAFLGLGICAESDNLRIGIALEEALTNALYHGNLGINSDIRDGDDSIFRSVVDQRRREEPYRARTIHVRARLTREEALVEIRDEGEGFNHQTLPDPTEAANLDKVTGRGVLLMRTFMDQIRYNDKGNQVTMVKRRAEETTCRAG